MQKSYSTQVSFHNYSYAKSPYILYLGLFGPLSAVSQTSVPMISYGEDLITQVAPFIKFFEKSKVSNTLRRKQNGIVYG